MARSLHTLAVVALLSAGATATNAAPVAMNQATHRSANHPVEHKPLMLNQIFAADRVGKQSPTSTGDILQLGLPKRDLARPTKAASPVMAVATSAAALIFVVSIFLLICWLMKRGAPRGMRGLPSEAFEILGRSSLGSQQAVQLVRVGNKLLLVASSSEGATTLTEIDDAEEVDRLLGICMAKNDTSATQEFHEAFEELATRSPAGFHAEDPGKSQAMIDLATPHSDSLTLSDMSLLAPSR